MARLAFLVVLCVGIAAAKHFRFSKSEIAAFERMCKNDEDPNACNPHTEKANARRAQIKQVFIESLMGSGNKRSDAEAGAEEWLQKIQEAKRAVQRSMGLGSIEPYDDGMWQGDVLLTKEQAEEIIAQHSGKKTGKRSISTKTAGKWANPIKYYIEPTVSATSRASIKKGIAQVQSTLGCVQFQEVTTKPAGKQHMNFIQDGTHQGCQGYAYIGYVGYANYDNTVAVNVDASFCQAKSGCAANSIVVHEIYHSLGYSHEQCRFDRDKFISLNTSNLNPQYANNFNLDTTSSFNHHNQAYNYRSVMHYQNTVFAKDSRYPTMNAIPKNPANDALMGNSCEAQATDIAIGKGLYCASG